MPFIYRNIFGPTGRRQNPMAFIPGYLFLPEREEALLGLIPPGSKRPWRAVPSKAWLMYSITVVVSQFETGETLIEPEKPDKNKAAQELGRLGGLKGGKARAEKLTPEQRTKIAKKTAAKRWEKKE